MYLKNKDLSNDINKFKDNEFGGYYSAISYDNDRILTKEKSLEDQSYVLLGMLKGERNKVDKIRTQVEYILKFLDENNSGMVEFKENYGLINELGHIKTTYRTFLGIYSLLEGAKFLNDSILISKLTNQYLRLQNKVFDFSKNLYQ